MTSRGKGILPQKYEIDKEALPWESQPWDYPLGIFSLAVFMEKLNFGLYWKACELLEYITHTLEKLPGNVNEYVPLARVMPEIMTRVARNLDKLNLTQSSIKARRIAEIRLEGSNVLENIDLKRQIEELQERIHDELNSQFFVYIPPNRAKYYENPQKDWEQIILRLSNPETLGDIEEAHKCFALSRYTASVFHLMRIMEKAVQLFGKKLRITLDPKKETWYQILIHVNKAIEKYPIATTQQRNKKSNYAAISAHLDNVRIADRNEVMHPKQTYSEEEAKDVLDSVRIFLNELKQIL